ncbi:MAG: hypothetical protein E7631_07115 [Ruminococcaceae bacterium]|nr:hypothetical protein [Oscillospiraceae bacterium]
MKYRRSFSALLALLLLVPSIVSCSPSGSGADTTDNNTLGNENAEGISVSEDQTEPEEPLDLPDRDFGGQNFHFYVMGIERNANNYSVEIYSEEQNGEVINDAVYSRNLSMADTYNFTITETPSAAGEDLAATVEQLVTAGDDTYQVAMLNLMNGGYLMTKGMLSDLSQMPHIDMSKSWWDGAIADDLTIGGKQLAAMGDINIMDNNATWAVFFNKKLLVDNGMDMPYSLVNEGTWTYEKFHEMSQVVATDLDGNGSMDDQDLWGTVGAAENTTFLFFSSGEQFTEKDENDIPQLKPLSDRTYSVLEAIFAFQCDNDTTLLVENAKKTYSNAWSDLIRANFRNDLALFYVAGLLTYTLMREMESEYGLLPLPKLDEAQTAYNTTINQGNCSTVTVPISCQDPDAVGFMLEALAHESQSTLTPAYFDVALQRKYMSDEESRGMLAIILENRTIDLAIAFGWGNIFSTLSAMTTSKNTDFASKYASITPSIESAMQKFVENVTGQ